MLFQNIPEELFGESALNFASWKGGSKSENNSIAVESSLSTSYKLFKFPRVAATSL